MPRSSCRLLAVACLAAALTVSPLAALEPSKALTQYLLTVWQTEHGLPQNSVYTIRQTRDGYLWLGTEEGLVRFDGVRFVVYDKRNTPAIRHNWIQSLQESRDGSLWIAIVGGGLARWKDGAFTSFGAAQGLPNDSVWDMAEAPDGSLWLATDGGLARFRDGRIETVGEGVPREQLRVLHRANDGSLWIGTDGHGLLRLIDGRVEKWTVEQGLSSNVIWAIRETSDGSVWIGTSAGLDQLRQGTLTHHNSDYIRALFEDRHGTLWVGLGGGGIARLRNGVFTTLTMSDGLSSNDIRSFWEDREGNLWVGTGGGGFARLRDGKFTVFGSREGLFGENVRAVMQDRSGAMWFAGRGGATRLRDGVAQTFTRADGLAGDVVYALYEDRAGAIWLGTESGLTRYDGTSFSTLGPADGMSHESVRAIHEDAAGLLWVGTEGGLNVRQADGRFRSFTTKDGLSNNAVLIIYPARDGTLWLGTRQGLNRVVNGKVETFAAGGLGRAPIIGIHQDADGTLWFASGAVGLFRLRGGVVTSFTSRHGLFDDTLMETLEDDAGNFWAGSNRGVFRLSKSELEEVASGRRPTVQSLVYGVADGLRSAECNGGSQPAGWKSTDGRLWFATIRGAAVIDPARLAANRVAPPVVIEQVTIGDRTWSASGALELPPGSNDLEIQYTALSFVAPERLRFHYQLEGFDKAPVDAGNRRTAFYTNIPPGTYRFRVTACNEDGVCGESRAPLPVTIAPRFHETVPFRLFLIALGIAAIFAIDRARIWRVRARERQLTTLVAERTRSLEAALAEAEHQRGEAERHRIEAEEANRAKSTFLANMSHELRTPMNSIIGFSEILAQRLDGKIEPKLHNFMTLVRNASQQLLALINDILDLTKVEMGKMEVFPESTRPRQVIEAVTQVMSAVSARADVSVRIDIEDDMPVMETDSGKLKQILFNLLSNAVKFSPPGAEITIAAQRSGEAVEISVTDRGPGIAAEDLNSVFQEFRQLGPARNAHVGTGLGLSLVKKFSELLRGSVRVESLVDIGTTFTVTLPIRYTAGAATETADAHTGPIVVMIDDDDEQWQNVREPIEAASFKLMRIQTGREALARLHRIAPAVAVLDLALRGGEGWEVLRALRADSIPVIVITSADDSHPATELGSAEVLIKPVQPWKLVERLRRALGADARGVRSPLHDH